jgi:hypothetical protein
MSLASSSTQGLISWKQYKTNNCFADTTQGNDAVYQVNSYESTDYDEIYTLCATLAVSGSQTVDLTNVSNLVCQNFAFSEVIAMMIRCTSGKVTYGPDATDGFNWYLSAGSTITIQEGGAYLYNGGSSSSVSGTSKNITITNTHTGTSEFILAIIGKKV